MLLEDYVPAWMRHLKAANRAPRTLTTYKKAADQFIAWYTDEHGQPPEAEAVTSADLTGWMAHLIDKGLAPTTRLQRYTSIQQLWKYMAEMEFVETNPMAKVPRPKAELPPVPVLEHEHIERLLAECTGRTFEDRRDTAIIRMFLDTGARLSEITNLKVGDLERDNRQAQVFGKGQRFRWVHWGSKTATALDAYLLGPRARHKNADEKWLWLGLNGKLSDSGVSQMLKRRSAAAGIPHVHAHLFRHYFAHSWLLSPEGTEGDLLALTGWRSRQMLDRYGRSAAGARAKAAHERIAPGDRF